MLKSRIPQIVAELSVKSDLIVSASARRIAEGARERVRIGPSDPHLYDAIHVDDDGTGEASVVAGDDDTFYGHMLEFGTSHAAPYPFLIPAAEAERDFLNMVYITMLRGL